MSDYIYPKFVTDILKKPSERTQMESSLVGITVMMLGSMAVTSYLIINGIVTGFWFIFLICASELGVLSFQFSLLSTTYQTYYSYKMEKGLYPEDYKLKIKVEEAKRIKGELDLTINKLEEMKGGKK